MKFTLIILSVIFLFHWKDLNAQHFHKYLSKHLIHNDTALVCLNIDRLSDINIQKEEYSIQFWVWIQYHKNDSINFKEQLQVLNAKNINSEITHYSVTHDTVNVELRVTCVMKHEWDVDGFPFDNQEIRLVIFNPFTNLVFKSDNDLVELPDSIAVGDGWNIDTQRINRHLVIESSLVSYDRFGNTENNSSFSIQLKIYRSQTFLLFLKLFVGMYVSFFVSFMAFFINLKHVEPRFGLPVGGLFAAIANKYVIEALLPQSPGLTLVDYLHDLTIIAILLIIFISSISLAYKDKKQGVENDFNYFKFKGWQSRFLKRISMVRPKTFLILYGSLNLLIIAIGYFHERLGFDF